MPRSYKRKTQQGAYGDDALSKALNEIRNGTTVRHASITYSIPRRTLARHRDEKVACPGVIRLGRYRAVLSMEFEEILVGHIQDMEKRLYGLTTVDVKKLAFDLAVNLGLAHPFDAQTKAAGHDWLAGFLKRHGILSIRSPQATSLSRSIGFNRPQVARFNTIYMDLLETLKPPVNAVWNMDETGITSVHTPGKILATKGARQVGKLTSGERGATVTVVCAMSAAGQFLPPMMVFPRKRMVEALMNGAPPGAIGCASDNGWSNSELFLKWLQHFADVTKSEKEHPTIIVLDGHHSHKTLEVIHFARDHGIHIITLPPHSTHKMQPLDRSFFKSLKCNYNTASDNWMTCHPGKRISFYDMAGLFAAAYNKSATVEKAVNGFRVSGIWPFSSDLFTDEDFAGSLVTDEPEAPATSQPIAVPTATSQPIAVPATTSQHIVVSASTMTSITEPTGPITPTDEPTGSTPPIANPTSPTPPITEPPRSAPPIAELPVAGTSRSFANQHDANKVREAIRVLSPFRTITTPRKRSKRAESSELITSSPYKLKVEEKAKAATIKSKAVAKRTFGDNGNEESKTKARKTNNPRKSMKQKADDNEEKKTKGGKTNGKATKRKVSYDDSDNNDNTPCSLCKRGYLEPPYEDWFKCVKCSAWQHESCGLEDEGLCYNCAE